MCARWCILSFGGFFLGYPSNNFLGQKIVRGIPINLMLKIVARGNAVQITPNFPAKRLSIYRRHFF